LNGASVLADATLADVCLLVTDGTHDTPRRTMVGLPLVKATEIVGGRIDFAACALISPEDHQKVIARSKPEQGDTLFAHIGASLGEAAYVSVDREFSIKNIALFKPDPEIVLGRYLYYLVRSPGFQGSAKSARTGSAQPFLGLAQLRRHPVRYHRDISTQHKIAAILSAYDDLIENSDRRIKLLEEIAQRIYREWFVDFRYPGHEDVPRVISELGSTPKGWELLSAAEAMTINPRIVVDRKAVRPFIPMASLSENGMHVSPIEERVAASGSKFENGDTLFARITPCLENGKTAYVQCLPDNVAAIGSTEFIVLRSRRLCPEFVYLLARDPRFRLHAKASMSGATGRQRVRDDCFDSFALAIPPGLVLNVFADTVRPLFALSHELFMGITWLRATRDLLLPRLISGEIDVADLDISMPEAAA
jgi:type I restriction enzyme, S subunit